MSRRRVRIAGVSRGGSFRCSRRFRRGPAGKRALSRARAGVAEGARAGALALWVGSGRTVGVASGVVGVGWRYGRSLALWA